MAFFGWRVYDSYKKFGTKFIAPVLCNSRLLSVAPGKAVKDSDRDDRVIKLPQQEMIAKEGWLQPVQHPAIRLPKHGVRHAQTAPKIDSLCRWTHPGTRRPDR